MHILSCVLVSHIFTHRNKGKENHVFIHLNLCIALTLGLVVFIAGIENATDDRVSSLANQMSTYIHYLHQNVVIFMLLYL